ncbi:MAG: hypothetical protein ACRC54_08710, partial [Fusobacteriaceae bacterium]
MRKKFLLSAIFVALMTNANALDITEDNYLNNGMINFENTQHNEENVIMKRDSVTVTNKGIISVSYTEKNQINQNSSENKGNGIVVEGNNVKINNNGLIQGNSLTIEATGSYFDNFGNGIRTIYGGSSTVVVTNQGVLQGNVNTQDGKGYHYSGNGVSANVLESNEGLIQGSIQGINNAGGASSGNGAYVDHINLNNGVIRGQAYYDTKGHVNLNEEGNGGGFNVETNNGLISGYSMVQVENPLINTHIFNAGNGSRKVKLNNGVLTGYSVIKGNSKKELQGGQGSYVDIYSEDFTTNNFGLIKGSQSAIGVTYSPWDPYNIEINNYGVMVGREIFSQMGETENKNLQKYEVQKENNQGTYINLKEDSSDKFMVALDSERDIIIEDIIVATNLNLSSPGGANNSGKTILNAKVSNINIIEKPSDINYVGSTVTQGKDSYEEINLDTNYKNYIINGAGIKNAVLSIKDGVNVNLSDSIVNGYKTAVSLDNNSTVTASNTIFNGGGLIGKDVVINVKGDSGNLRISGESIINGKIDVLGSNSTVSIGNEVMINGDLTSSKNSDNTLNLGDGLTSKELRLFYNINGFEKINTLGNITIFETAKIGDSNINLQSGNLILRVNPLERNQNGDIIGHALYDHKGNISSEGGNLLIGLNGVGKNEIIATHETTIDKGMDTIYNETDKLKTNSLVLDAILLENGNIKISVLDYIPLPSPPVEPGESEDSFQNSSLNPNSLLYKHLNKVYKSIVSAGEIGKLANTTLLEGKTYNESLGGLLTMLDQVYANNPYAYTVKSSRDSLKLFEDNMSYLTIKPNEGEWIAQGKAIYTG